MRAMAIVGMGILMGASLAGCDQTTTAPQQQTAQAAPPVVAAPPPCNCGERAAPDNHLTRLSYVPRHRHHYEGGYHGSYTSRSEESVDSYGYVSASSVSYSESSSSTSEGGAYDRDGYIAHGHRYYRGGIQWVDGYGRGYYGGQRPTVAQEMTGKRAAVWHGYDADCPDQPRGGPDGY
ncbi:MAG TPA: hypothetical protein VGH02_05600 [Rhizomicrobium sp.]